MTLSIDICKVVRPKKHLGQHFLHDQNIASRIVKALPDPIERLLEIGPGKGVLTRYLIEKEDINLKLIEIDPEAVSYLVHTFGLESDRLIQGDFLRLDLRDLFNDSFWIIGNFPYNISSQILFRAYEHVALVDGLVGMFQREVARRVVSPPGSKEYGILSVLLQAHYEIEYLFSVPEGAFFPPPAVKSGVIRLRRRLPAGQSLVDDRFTAVVKAAFNQRRKTLRNALRPLGIQPDLIPSDLIGKRAEQLSVEEFQRLEMATRTRNQ